LERAETRWSDWMSTKDASTHLGVTLRTLYRLIDDVDLAIAESGK
jgi:hypothetical protein